MCFSRGSDPTDPCKLREETDPRLDQTCFTDFPFLQEVVILDAPSLDIDGSCVNEETGAMPTMVGTQQSAIC